MGDRTMATVIVVGFIIVCCVIVVRIKQYLDEKKKPRSYCFAAGFKFTRPGTSPPLGSIACAHTLLNASFSSGYCATKARARPGRPLFVHLRFLCFAPDSL